MVNLLQARHACTTAPKAGILPWMLVSWSRSCDKIETKILTSKTKAKTKTSTLKTKAKSKAPKSKTKTKAVKICLKAASRRGTASRHHITGLFTHYASLASFPVDVHRIILLSVVLRVRKYDNMMTMTVAFYC